jgi:hypothetical protein
VDWHRHPARLIGGKVRTACGGHQMKYRVVDHRAQGVDGLAEQRRRSGWYRPDRDDLEVGLAVRSVDLLEL